MLSIQVYPVMDGVELWVAASCRQRDESHTHHRGDSVATYVDRERIDKHGLEVVVGSELTVILSEFPSLAVCASC